MATEWRKPRRSTSAGSNCVEVQAREGFVGIRDSKNTAGGMVEVSQKTFGRFCGFAASFPSTG